MFRLLPNCCARGHAWRRELGRAVVLAAITREGEEELLLQRLACACRARGHCCCWCRATRSALTMWLP
jgi:hypothetical protein